MKLLTVFAAFALISAPAQAQSAFLRCLLSDGDEGCTRTLTDLKAEGKNCNVFRDKPFVMTHHVLDRKSATVEVMTTNSFLGMKKDENGNYVKTDCDASQVKIFCLGGDCQVIMNSGSYGYHPGNESVVIIDGRRFSWVGDMPSGIGRQMYRSLKEGSVVKSSIARWPGRFTNFSEIMHDVQQAKDLAYTLATAK